MQNAYHSPSVPRSPNLGTRLLSAWYRIAAPPEPPAHSPLLVREIARRGRVTSLVMFVNIAMVLLVFIVQPSVQVSVVLGVVTCIDVVALLFNRKGRITVAGIIITLTTEGGILLSLVGGLQTPPGGINLYVITAFPLLVQGIVVAVSTLPPLSALGMLALNCGVAFAVVKFSPFSAPFLTYIHTYEHQTFFGLLEIPFAVFLSVGFVSLIWVLSANDAIKRADRADARAEYEQEMALRERETSDKLNHDLQVIAQVIAAIAGDPTREIQVDRDNSLWLLATSLNNLRGRLLNVRFERSQFRELHSAATTLISWLDTALATESLPPWIRSKTMMDEIVYRLQMLPLQAKLRKEAQGRYHLDSTALQTEQERQRLSQGISQLHTALIFPHTVSWQPTGTVLDDVAERLLSPQAPPTRRSLSQPLPNFTPPRHNSDI